MNTTTKIKISARSLAAKKAARTRKRRAKFRARDAAEKLAAAREMYRSALAALELVQSKIDRMNACIALISDFPAGNSDDEISDDKVSIRAEWGEPALRLAEQHATTRLRAAEWYLAQTAEEVLP